MVDIDQSFHFFLVDGTFLFLVFPFQLTVVSFYDIDNEKNDDDLLRETVADKLSLLSKSFGLFYILLRISIYFSEFLSYNT